MELELVGRVKSEVVEAFVGQMGRMPTAPPIWVSSGKKAAKLLELLIQKQVVEAGTEASSQQRQKYYWRKMEGLPSLLTYHLEKVDNCTGNGDKTLLQKSY
nr:hypothetical transcript [Hymenolepis microstoma]